MTVSNIDTDYDAHSSTTTKTANGTLVTLSGSTLNLRTAWRFPLGAITAGATVSDVVFQVNISLENIESTDQVNLNAYNSTGDDDPSADAAATFHSRCGGTTLVSETTAYQTVGSKQTDLTATADGQVEGNITSPARWSLGMTQTNFATTEQVDFEAIENVSSDPATLIVTWTVPIDRVPIPTLVQSAVHRAFSW